MKTIMFLTFFICSLFSTLPSTPSAVATNEAVLDVAKNPLRTGVSYNILPVLRGRGGGVTILPAGTGDPCKYIVGQEPVDVLDGFPLSFYPATQKKGVIRVSTDHNIDFSLIVRHSCLSGINTTWTLGNFDELTKQWFVTNGGVLGNPGPSTTANWFKIEKYKRDYKLVFCPSVCNFCKVMCRDIGIFTKDGDRYLALSDVPFMVKFKKQF